MKMAKIRDYKPDTWVGEDNLGRQLLQAKDLKAANPDAKVGIFYLYWHDQRQKGLTIYDHTKLYNEGGVDAVWDAIPKGPMGQAHYWAEPYFGYYMSDDEWVIRKHAKMLVEAGVDFIFIDNTNGLSYPYTYLRIYQIYMQMRKEGQMTPQIVHFIGVLPDLVTNFMKEVYDNIYATDYYKDLWFMWEGKPLILGTMEKVPEYRKYFTNRECWAYDDWIGDGMGKWPWITSYPQTPGRNPETGEIEQVVASCGFHANGSTGRSFHDGQQPTDGKNDFEFELSTTPYGLGFARANEAGA